MGQLLQFCDSFNSSQEPFARTELNFGNPRYHGPGGNLPAEQRHKQIILKAIGYEA